MRKLLVHRDYNTVQASAVPLGDVNTDPARERLPFPIYGTFMDITENAGEGQFNALQLELQRRYKDGFAINAAYTLPTPTATPPTAATARSASSSTTPTTSRRTAARTPMSTSTGWC